MIRFDYKIEINLSWLENKVFLPRHVPLSGVFVQLVMIQTFEGGIRVEDDLVAVFLLKNKRNEMTLKPM
jgi:hypothetical protein